MKVYSLARLVLAHSPMQFAIIRPQMDAVMAPKAGQGTATEVVRSVGGCVSW